MKTTNQEHNLCQQLNHSIANRSIALFQSLPFFGLVCISLWLALASLWPRVQAVQASQDGIWEATESVATDSRNDRQIPAQMRGYRLHEAALTRLLSLAPATTAILPLRLK